MSEHSPLKSLSQFTQVLSGTRTIFRNVFVRELDEIRVPGMVDWYQSMSREGMRSFHYVSNSPFELFGSVVKPFLRLFPSGSVNLKQYSGSSTSMISKLWEDAGSRKRTSVVKILENFPQSK
jgi:phosphatidate phosphatase APP1